MIIVLAVHAVLALSCLWFGDRLGRRALVVGLIGPLSALVPLVVWASGGQLVAFETVEWLPALGLDIAFRMDGFSALMVGLVGVIGCLVFVYSWFYLGDHRRVGQFSGSLVGFAGAMFGLVTADNLLVLFVFWELTTVMSYLLIGFEDDQAAARSSALQALLVTGVGGLAMLAGIVILAQAGGTYLLSELLSNPPEGGLVSVGLVLVLVGAFAKSAQFPLHFWLPGAMAAPTPVSAYLHSATMVKAGVYLVARLAPVFAVSVGWWRPLVAAVGLVTMLVGGWRALVQHDIKLLLAHGTVSQLGLIMILVGWGSPGATFAGVALILAHALFKGSLFMVAGIVDHSAHTRDMRRLSGLRHRLPTLFRLSVAAVASMVGLPPLLGYLAKEGAWAALVPHGPGWLVAGVAAGSMLTVAYGLRFLQGTFGGPVIDEASIGINGVKVTRAPPGFQEPAAVLAASGIALGVLPRLANEIVGPAALAVDAATHSVHLELWHGFGWPIVLSALALAGGWLVWRWPLPYLRRMTSRVPEATRMYAGVIEGVNRGADRLTSVLQNGSLPVYLVVIVTVAVAAPGVVMATHWRQMPSLVLADSPVQFVTAALVISAAVGTMLASRRLGAVILLGGVGYGVAVLFVIQGAPDLALTQLLIETLALALFAFVLSRLPARFEVRQSRLRQASRVGVSVAAGVGAMCLALWSVSGRVAPSLAPEFMATAEPEGGGRNVVNVILTDFRALDTLGEITVLVLAAMGAIALVTARRPEESPDTEGSEK